MYLQFYMCQAHSIESASYFYAKEPLLHANRLLEYHVILYVEYGRWDVQYRNHTLQMQAGDVVFMPANIPHFGVTPCLTGTKGLFLHYYPNHKDRVSDQINSNKEYLSLPAVIHTLDNQAIREQFVQIAGLYGSALPYKLRLCSSLFDQLLLSLSELRTLPTPELRLQIDEIFSKNTERFLTNKQIAKELNISLKTLERQFKTVSGKTVHQYQIDRKLESAKELLRSYSEITLYEIALSLGFYDASHFSRVFKNKFGISPEVFRKNNK